MDKTMLMLSEIKQTFQKEMVATPPADSRRTHQKVPLLPSGPGGVPNLASRGDERSYHNGSSHFANVCLTA